MKHKPIDGTGVPQSARPPMRGAREGRGAVVITFKPARRLPIVRLKQQLQAFYRRLDGLLNTAEVAITLGPQQHPCVPQAASTANVLPFRRPLARRR